MEYTMTPAQPEQGAPVTNEVIYAGFWKRFLARLLDSLIGSLAGGILVLVILVGASLGEKGGVAAMIFMYAVIIFGGWLYQTLMESSKHQATLGKMALGLRVTDLNGNRISWGHANARFFASILSSMTLWIGYIMAAFTQKKQALHDMVASTLVLGQQSSVPANVAQNAFQL